MLPGPCLAWALLSLVMLPSLEGPAADTSKTQGNNRDGRCTLQQQGIGSLDKLRGGGEQGLSTSASGC